MELPGRSHTAADLGSRPALLDVSRLVLRAWQGKLPTGIDRTALAYVAHFRGRAQAVVQRNSSTRVLSPLQSLQLFDIVLGSNGERRGALVRLFFKSLLPGVPRSLEGRLYLNVGHTGLNQIGHTNWLKRSGVRPVYFVHDLIPLTHPEYARPGEPQKHLLRMRALLSNGVGVIGNSRDTIDNLAIFARSQRIVMPPVVVAPLGVAVEWRDESVPSFTLPERPYFVILGTIEGRKNHLLILNIWADLARRLGAACPQLVVIGQRGWESEQAVDMLERCEAIRGHVIELPRCEDARLAAYIRGARALLFPSFVEGYGLPLVEALSLGTPVIATDLAVFRELAGGIPDYLNPLDGVGWTRLIENYARPESDMRAAQAARLKGWKAPSWEDHFGRLDAWLKNLGFMQL